MSLINKIYKKSWQLGLCLTLLVLSPKVTFSAADGAGEALATVNRLTEKSIANKISNRLQRVKKPEDLIPDYEPDIEDGDVITQEPYFVLKSIVSVGNKVFESSDFDILYKPYIGQKVKLSDMKKIAVEITKKYRKAGYFLSYAGVPAQTIKDGKVTMQIFEGYIDQVNIIFEEKNKNPSSRLFNLVHKLRKSRPLHQNTYERYLMLIRDLYPAAKGYLEPSHKSTDGAASLKIFIPKNQPIEGSVGVNNFANDTVGPWMQSVNLSIAPFWNPEHRITTSLSKGASLYELTALNLGYQMPVFAEGTTFSINQMISRSNPAGKIKVFKVKMRNYRTTFTLLHPVIRSRDTNMYAGIELAIQNQYKKHGSTDELFKERSRNLKLFTINSWMDQLGGSNFVRLSGIQGLNMLRAKKESSPNLTRVGASSDRFYFEGEISRMQKLAGPFAAGFYITGQYAGAALLDIDRYRSNGFPFNGAYPVGALSGDSGIEGKIELNYYNYDIRYLELFRLFIYVSKMKIWNRHPTTVEKYTESAKGGGIGTQIVMENGLSSTLQYGYPFDSPVGGDPIKPQVGLNVNWKF
tara:strand:+ start:1629 stop:3365 length:1737 start_codon:yes stop_codon:yes gene_type:complete